MKIVRSCRHRSIFLLVTLLTLPLSTSASFKKTKSRLSNVEMYQLLENPADTYIYCDGTHSKMADLISQISEVDQDKNSVVWQLRNHIEEGFSIGLKDSVLEALEYAQKVMHKAFSADHAAHVQAILNAVLNQIDMGQLNVSLQSAFAVNNAPAAVVEAPVAEEAVEAPVAVEAVEAPVAEEAPAMTEAPIAEETNDMPAADEEDADFRSKTIKVKDKTKFYKDVTFKDKADFKHFVGFHGNVHFWKNVEIDGTLSAADAIIGCDLTVGCNLSMNDSISPAIGNVIKNGVPFIHNYPGIAARNTFVGDNAGNFIMTGTDNSGFGDSALTANTTGIQNTAIGSSAMSNNITGSNSVAVGWSAYSSGDYNVIVGSDAGNDGSQNVGIGYQTLFNIETNQNVAIGYQAMQNTTGATNDTAVGYQALQNDQAGVNTAIGAFAMTDNIDGVLNTASGYAALADNIFGSVNTAHGALALVNNIEGNANTALGFIAMVDNTTGNANTAVGLGALISNTTGNANTVLGIRALDNNVTGNDNIAIGAHAGTTLLTGNNNVYIASEGAPAESGTIRIGTDLVHTITVVQGIFGGAVTVGNMPVLVDLNGHLGTVPSGRRFKQNIADMDIESEGIYRLRPVTFSYKSDESNTKEYGLIAEEVAEIFPSLIAHDRDGSIYSVRYQVLPMLLLNEVQKQHAIIEQQSVAIENINSRLVTLEEKN